MSTYLHRTINKQSIRPVATPHKWHTDSLERLRRFLILGSEGGTFYAGERQLTIENTGVAWEAFDEHGTAAVAEIVTISKERRAPKNTPALYTLALACAHDNPDVRGYAAEEIPTVARTGTDLFHFVEFVESVRGWGRALKRGVSLWYETKTPEQLAYQLVKYRQRSGWTHRDVLRLAHPEAPTPAHAALYDFACGHELTGGAETELEALESVMGFTFAQEASTPAETIGLIKRFGSALPREALNTDHLKDPDVWEALLHTGMPMEALIRNLATMTRSGLLAPMSSASRKVIDTIGGEQLQESRIHPVKILAALLTYKAGRSARGSSTWTPVPQIIDALDGAFYAAFGNVEPAGKRTLLALDVSGSMAWPEELGGVVGLTPRVASAAIALITAATEPDYHILAFSSGLIPVDITPRDRLDTAIDKVSRLPFSATDCSLPMQWARRVRTKTQVETFVTYTDNETNHGMSPAQALAEYRHETGIDARLAVCAMSSGGFSIADPDDPGMLDLVGFDTNTPQVISNFSAGR